MEIRRAKMKEDKLAKIICKVKSPKMNMYRQYFCFEVFIYNIKIKALEYVKLKQSKTNL